MSTQPTDPAREVLSGARSDGIHREVWRLIPWIVNGTATKPQIAQMEAHLISCASCRAEYRLQQQLCGVLSREAAAPHNPEAGLSKLNEVLDRRSMFGPGLIGQSPRRQSSPWQRIAAPLALVQALVIFGLIVRPVTHAPRDLGATGAEPGATYETLATAPKPNHLQPPQIRVAAADDAKVGVLLAAFAQQNLEVVELQGARPVFGLAWSQHYRDHSAFAQSSAMATALTALRRTPGVVLAERVIVLPTPTDPKLSEAGK